MYIIVTLFRTAMIGGSTRTTLTRELLITYEKNGTSNSTLLTITVCPVIIKSVTHFLIDGAHGLHVGLAPLPA